MPNYNEAVIGPKNFILEGQLILDPTTILTPPKPKSYPPLKTLTVANGGSLLVYDVSDPSNPVLINTIG